MSKIKKQKKHVCLVKWRKRIQEAKNRGYFTALEITLAGDWNVCAVGEGRTYLNPSIATTEFIKGGKSGWMNPDQLGPMDNRLEVLGGKFIDYVGDNKFYSASRCLDAIERRLNKLYVLV